MSFIIPQPVSPPSWWRQRTPKASPIEESFQSELGDFASKIEAEHWFGDKGNHHRYRVDFLLRDVRLIVELDGHEYHSSRKQIQADNLRTRYLASAGYTVIRFSGAEVHKNAKSCVEKVRRLYKERLSLSQVKHRVVYVDFAFASAHIEYSIKTLRELHPGRTFTAPDVLDAITSGIEWLHERSFVTVFIFIGDSDKEILKLDGITREYPRGDVRINVVHDPLYGCALGEHAAAHTHLFDDFYLIGDDRIYIGAFSEVFTTCRGKLLRWGNEETSYAGSDLANVQWQRFYYAVCHAMGLQLHEM